MDMVEYFICSQPYPTIYWTIWGKFRMLAAADLEILAALSVALITDTIYKTSISPEPYVISNT